MYISTVCVTVFTYSCVPEYLFVWLAECVPSQLGCGVCRGG